MSHDVRKPNFCICENIDADQLRGNRETDPSAFVFATQIVRGVFQKYAERFHRMFANAARLMIFHVKHAWYMLIQ